MTIFSLTGLVVCCPALRKKDVSEFLSNFFFFPKVLGFFCSVPDQSVWASWRFEGHTKNCGWMWRCCLRPT
ncbi:hypothetical protein BDB00DRAFT_797013 [Zychaea mexicana]|uniref:uncharacterized protein n=1 Tax=Zychaea mexicana TaxID=64656 RepID=UPI0022FDF6BD|nr:uncharacterized protein BDB00DRAFT_797013 [Zychaea mexicana]KAI9498865.1 hypothetical protein BDB00DRAFT_797013 [Zychaea mexicana]